MLFRNMGLFWKRSDVLWGHPNKKGCLKGVLKTAKRSNKVDFWDQIGVYVLYSNFELVYVGQSSGAKKRLGVRLRNHTTDDLANRWDTFSWFGMRFVKKNGLLSEPPEKRAVTAKDILNLVEGILIAVSEPPLNRQGGRFGDHVQQYLQRSGSEKTLPRSSDSSGGNS